MTDKKHDHQKCLSLFKKLSEYLDNELDDKTCEEIRHHMEECIRCKVCLETLKRTVELCRNIKTAGIPDSLKERLKLMVYDPSNP